MSYDSGRNMSNQSSTNDNTAAGTSNASTNLHAPDHANEGNNPNTSTHANAHSEVGARPPTKQRKLNRSSHQLKRNAACLPCRRRRIKCDAGKPHCSSCVRSYHFLARTQPDEERDSKGIQCSYGDDVEDLEDSPSNLNNAGNHTMGTAMGSSAGRKDGSVGLKAVGSSPHSHPHPHDIVSRGTKRKDSAQTVDDGQDPQDIIRKLEEKINELQQALAATSVSSNPATATTSLPSAQTSTAPRLTSYQPHTTDPNAWTGPPHETFPIDVPYTIPPSVNNGLPPGSFGPGPGVGGALPPSHLDQRPHDSVPSGYGPTPALPIVSPGYKFDATVTDDLDAEAGRMGGPFLDLLWPGWPPRLPTPAMLDHLVETFFTSVPSVPRAIHRQSFLARLALPPTHPNFPHLALLHAICSASARYTAVVKCRSVSVSIEKSTEDARRAAGKGLAFEDVADETCFSERNAKYAFQAMRYENVSPRCLLDILQAMIIMGHWGQSNARWIEGWIIIGGQARLAICLGLFDHQPDDFGAPTLRRSILPPPETDAEREERRAVMYFILSYDILSSSSSGWPNTLPVDEFSARMPCSRADFDGPDPLPENHQYYHSPDLFTRHPVADGFIMMVKGQILLGRACKFIRSCRAMDPSERPWAKQLPEFRKIDSDIAAFNMSFPQSLRDPVQYMHGYAKGVNADLIAAHLVPRVASIFLHEPFADLGDPSCPSASRLLLEARACLNIVYLLVSSNADISYSVAPITSCDYFFTAARTLVLFFQHALEQGDRSAAYTFRSEIAIFKLAFSGLAHRFVMGARHMIMIEMMVRHVEEDVLGHPLPDDPPISFTLPGAPPAWQVAHPDLRRPSEPGPDHRGQQESTTVQRPDAEKFYFPDTHPDGMVSNQIHTINTGKSRQMSVHSVLDQRRGFVGPPKDSPTSGSSHSQSNSISGGPSPNNPLNWPPSYDQSQFHQNQNPRGNGSGNGQNQDPSLGNQHHHSIQSRSQHSVDHQNRYHNEIHEQNYNSATQYTGSVSHNAQNSIPHQTPNQPLPPIHQLPPTSTSTSISMRPRYIGEEVRFVPIETEVPDRHLTHPGEFGSGL